MTIKYVEIVPARLAIGGIDATYGVQFSYETKVGKTWEFDSNSDAVGQYASRRTGRIKVFFNPVEDTMAFPEDANRARAYVMSIEKARELYKLITSTTQYWYALDIAYQAEKA